MAVVLIVLGPRHPVGLAPRPHLSDNRGHGELPALQPLTTRSNPIGEQRCGQRMHHATRLRTRGRCAIWAVALCVTAPAWAGPPIVPSTNALTTLDGVPLGTAVAARSSYPTILYDAPSATYHMWVAVVDETPPGTSGPDFYPLRISGYRHATSADGATFTTTGTMSFAGSPFATQIFGSAYGEPPWFYPKAAVWNGRYTLAMWTINGFFGPPSLGDYNYNISFDDVGPNPSVLALTHEGPVGAVPENGIAGQSAGIFGIVNGVMYYDNNSLLGRAAITDNGSQPYPAAAATGPWRVTGVNSAVADPLTPLGLVACQFAGGNTYVHNDARVLDNGDGTLGWVFTLRNCDGSRKSQQIYYMQSADNGLSWSAPVGIVTGPVTIGGVTPIGGFALSDVVMVNGQRVVYFNAADALGQLHVGAAPPPSVTVSAVPSINPILLLLTACALLAAGCFRLARRPRDGCRVWERGPGE